jgi:hypothetical protein
MTLTGIVVFKKLSKVERNSVLDELFWVELVANLINSFG